MANGVGSMVPAGQGPGLPTEGEHETAGWRRRFPLHGAREYGVVGAFVVLFVLLSIFSDAFLTKDNLLAMLEQWAPVGIMAAAQTLVIIAGGFDLSVGAVYALAGVLAAKVALVAPVELAILAGMGAGLGVGMFNGFLTTTIRINPFMATLASSLMIRGVALAITSGFLVTVASSSFSTLGTGDFIEVKYSAWVFLGFTLLCGYLLSRTKFGRYIYASGGNAEAARLSGVRVGLVRFSAFALSGLSAGLAGVIVASRIGSGQADAGTGIEFQVISAVVIGGTSILGGEGAIWRTFLGVGILALINNGFTLISISPVYQQVINGAIIIVAVGIDTWSRRRTT